MHTAQGPKAHDGKHWALYNDSQAGRRPRELLLDVAELAGPGDRRTAVDLGCGAGIETRALLERGWDVVAIDSAPGTEERVTAALDAYAPWLTIRADPFASGLDAITADLVYAGYALPYALPAEFPDLWTRILACLRPGGWIAVDLFGDHDSWAGQTDKTFLTETAARQLFEGMRIKSFDVEEEDGPAFSGPKHWHVFHVIARRIV